MSCKETKKKASEEILAELKKSLESYKLIEKDEAKTDALEICYKRIVSGRKRKNIRWPLEYIGRNEYTQPFMDFADSLFPGIERIEKYAKMEFDRLEADFSNAMEMPDGPEKLSELIWVPNASVEDSFKRWGAHSIFRLEYMYNGVNEIYKQKETEIQRLRDQGIEPFLPYTAYFWYRMEKDIPEECLGYPKTREYYMEEYGNG